MVRTKQTAKRLPETGAEQKEEEEQHNELGVIPTEAADAAAPTAETTERKPAKLRKAAARKKAVASEEVDGVKKARKRRRAKPGVKALREIRDAQKSTKLLLRKLPFSRLVREVAQDMHGLNDHLRFAEEAIPTLQEASEDYLVRMFQTAGLFAVSSKKKMLMHHHMRLARRIGANEMSPSFMDPVVNEAMMAENGFRKEK